MANRNDVSIRTAAYRIFVNAILKFENLLLIFCVLDLKIYQFRVTAQYIFLLSAKRGLPLVGWKFLLIVLD
jgi:hypothetical protein